LIRGLMTDDEWAYFELFWLMRTGAPWRDLPEEFGNWNSIFRQSRRWADSGIWDVILEALAGSGVADATLQMIEAGRTLFPPMSGRQSNVAPSDLTRRDRTRWLGRRDSNLCILESEFAKTLSPGGGTRTCASRIKGASSWLADQSDRPSRQFVIVNRRRKAK
jgi:hypothetical protein